MTVRRIVRGDDPAITAIGRIYEASIPASERKPTAWIGEAAGRPDFAVLVAEAHGVAVGFSTVFVPTASAALLEYLAVDRDERGSGVGSQLFAASAELAGSRPLLVEVDAPIDEVTRRRMEFYERQGCATIEGVRYILPLPTNPPPMRLMIRSQQSVPDDATLRRWIGVVYVHVYGAREDDPRLDEMLSDKHRHGSVQRP